MVLALNCTSKFCYKREHVKIRTYYKKEFVSRITKAFNSLKRDLENIQTHPDLKRRKCCGF